MRSIPAGALLLMLATGAARAGELFGTLTEAGKAVNAGVRVEITISGKTYAGETDKFGSYRLIVKEKGKATLTVFYKDQKPAFQLVSYDRATRYDLVLEAKDSTYSLRRK
jgi:hypothetical protein